MRGEGVCVCLCGGGCVTETGVAGIGGSAGVVVCLSQRLG